MYKDIQLNVRYIREDGKYLGGLHTQKLEAGQKGIFTVPDNGGLEHILEGVVISSAETKDGLYSYLLKLNPPAPQRVRDMQWFREMKRCHIGSVEHEKLRIYTDVVLIVRSRFEKEFYSSELNKKFEITGEVVSEDKELYSGLKYSFTIKLDSKLNEEYYKFLKSIDVDKG